MGFLNRFRSPGKKPASTGQTRPADAYLGLRDRLLQTAPGDVGISPTADAPQVWGVLLEMARGDATVTVVALADGTTSLYTSTGGGVLGGGAHARIAAASKALVRLADAHLAAFPAVDAVSLPDAGRSALVVLTYAGPRRVEEADGVLSGDRGPVSAVYAAAQNVITELRLQEESRQRAQ